MPEATILGFDVGTKHIGVALGNTITHSSKALTTITYDDEKTLVSQLQTLIAEWHPDAFVVGIPLNMDGSDQPMTEFARAFAERLKSAFDKPVYTVDERLSTLEAKQTVFKNKGFKGLNKNAVNSEAARIILDSWLRTTT